MFWQSSDSSLGNCAICGNPHPSQTRGRAVQWGAQEGGDRDWQALAHCLAMSQALH